MKHKFFTTLLSVLTSLMFFTVNAQTWTAPVATAVDPVSGGQYRVKNVDAEAFLTGASVWYEWYTSAALVKDGVENVEPLTFTLTYNEEKEGWTFARISDGKFTFISGQFGEVDAHHGWGEMHVDMDKQGHQYFEITKQESGYYRIRAIAADDTYGSTMDGYADKCWGTKLDETEGFHENHTAGVLAAYATVNPSEGFACDWQFMDMPLYNAKVDLYNLAKEIEDSQLGVDYAQFTEAYNGDDLDALNKAKESLKKLVIAAKISIAVKTIPTDLSFAIDNYDFEDCAWWTLPGWSYSTPNGGSVKDYNTTAAEYWNEKAANGSFDYYQEVAGLPAGRYTITAKMWNSTNGEDGASFKATSGVYGYAKNDSVMAMVTDDIDAASAKEYKTGTIVLGENDTLRVGVKNFETMAARWFGVDYIHLTYHGAVPACELVADDVEVNVNDASTGNLEIGLNNNITNFLGFQMDVTLPEGISLDKTACKLSNRITEEDTELSIGKQGDNVYRLLFSSLTDTPISGTSGTLLTLKLTATNNSKSGQATISNIRFVTNESERVTLDDKKFEISVVKTPFNLTYKVDGEVYKSIEIVCDTPIEPEAEPTKEGYTFSGWSEIPETMPAHDVEITGTFTINSYTLTYKVDGEVASSEKVEYASKLTLKDEPTKDGYTFGGWSELPATMPAHDVEVVGRFYIFGDVNTDEEVDVVDVVDIARFVVKRPSELFREKLADLNKDEKVDLGDAVALVNIIVGDQNFVKEMRFAPRRNMVADAMTISKTESGVAINLDNVRNYTALQFDLYVSEKAEVEKMMLNAQRKQKHQLLFNKVEDGHYRVVALSTSNNTFLGNEGELFSLVMNGDASNEVAVRNIQLFDTDGNGYSFADISLGTETGISSLQTLGSENKVIYDLQGRKLTNKQRGVNIVNGKKVIVK